MIGYSINQFKNLDDISLPITATTINRSYAAFEFFTLVNKKPFFIDRHLNRLFTTLQLLSIEIPFSLDALKSIILTLIQQNPSTEIAYKLFVIPEPTTDFQKFKGEVYIFPVPNIPALNPTINKGAKLITKTYQRFLPEAKTTNYTAYIYWEHEVLATKAVDVLYIDHPFVRETARSNVFMVKKGIIYTPKNKVLQGITKSIITDLIKKNTYEFIEDDICIDFLLSCDEVFVTSTTREVMAITQIDDTFINNGTIGGITKKLHHQFNELKEFY